MIKNSVKQMLRTPLRSISFLLLIFLSALLLTLGVVLWVNNNTIIHGYEDSFITIGTVEQKAFSFSQSAHWDAGLKDYRLIQKPEYSTFLPFSLLSFEEADYVQRPEKRSYYGSYAPEYRLWNDQYPYSFPVVIAEISPMEDCTPDESVLIKVNKLLFGDSSFEGAVLWFCNHYTKNPKPLEKGKNYAVVMVIQFWTHGEQYEEIKGTEERTLEYVPVELLATQYEPDGVQMKDVLEAEVTEDSPYYEVTGGFYDTDIGERLLNLADGYSMLRETMPVTGTNATKLLMSFYREDSYISEGRDITEEEYEEGRKVCLVSGEFADNNDFTIGDSVHLQLYFTNSRISAGQMYPLHNGGVEQWLPITAEGEVLSIFEDSRYTIVGMYDSSPGASLDDYSIGQNEVIVPLASIENQNSCHIMEYGPMKGSTTSFQIPNGSIENYLTAWEKYGTDELEISFYDMGYSQLKSGLENMKRVSLLLSVVGILMVVFLLLFYSHLFIVNQRERTAIERCLGVEKKQCRRSLLSGILVLLVMGSLFGCGLGGMLSQRISAENMNRVYYDASYSSVIATEMEETAERREDNNAVVMIASISAGICIILLGTGISIGRINANLKAEPMRLLGEKGRD
ncbi:MAG: ABC transporter permease [Lachnospiraceae bacterium]